MTSDVGPRAVTESPRTRTYQAIVFARSGASRSTSTRSKCSESRIAPGAKRGAPAPDPGGADVGRPHVVRVVADEGVEVAAVPGGRRARHHGADLPQRLLR